jgi:hypothetical protein
MAFFEQNDWAQTVLRMMDELERPDFIRAQLDAQPEDQRVEFVIAALSMDPPLNFYTIYTIGRMQPQEVNNFFTDPKNFSHLYRILKRSSNENMEYLDPKFGEYCDALKTNRWPGTKADLTLFFQKTFSLTPENTDVLVKRAILPILNFVDSETEVTAKTEQERDVLLYQQLTTAAQKEMQYQKWSSASKIWARVVELCQSRGWSEQEEYARNQMNTAQQVVSVSSQKGEEYEDKVVMARGYSAKGLWEKAAKLWASILELCQFQGWMIQAQEAEEQLEIANRRLQRSAPDSSINSAEAEALQSLSQKFNSIPKVDDLASSAVGYTSDEGKITGLSLRGLKLTIAPDEIGKLQNVEYLDLSDNALSQIPSWIEDLHELKIINLSKNQIDDLPEQFGVLQQLEEFYAWANLFQTIPQCLSQLQNLKRLDLSKNQIENLPEWMGNFPNLEWFRLVANPISSLSEQVKSDFKELIAKGCEFIGIETLLL